MKAYIVDTPFGRRYVLAKNAVDVLNSLNRMNGDCDYKDMWHPRKRG